MIDRLYLNGYVPLLRCLENLCRSCGRLHKRHKRSSASQRESVITTPAGAHTFTPLFSGDAVLLLAP